MSFRVGLFILVLLTWVTAFAREDDCDPATNSPAQSRKEACQIRCEVFYQKHPQSRPANKKHTCEDLGEWFDRAFISPSTLSREEQKQLAGACDQGIVDAIKDIPNKMRLYLATVQKFGDWVKDGIQKHQQFIEDCRKDISCKREVARFMVQYRQKNPDGSFVLSDAQVDQQIQNQDFLQLAMNVQEQRSQMQRVCSNQLSTINRKLQPAGGDWNYELLARRYDELQKWDPYCPIALKFNRPTPDSVDAESTKNFEFWDNLKTKIQCQSPEKNRKDVCGEITALIADPLNLIPVGGAAVKAGANFVARKTGVEVAERVVAREASAIARKETAEAAPSIATKQKKISTTKELMDEHSTQVLTTTKQNQDWVDRAKTVQKKDGQTFIDISNSVQKPCNDTLGKAMCDAINNRYFEKVLKAVEEMKSDFPKMTPYTDWKSYRVHFDGPLSSAQKEKLNQIFKSANNEIEKEMKDLGLSIPGKDTKNMYHAGAGQTADQADNTARIARDLSGENHVYWFDDSYIQKNGNSYVKLSENFRQEVATGWADTGLLETVEGTNKVIPNEKVMAWARKESDTAKLTEILNKDLGTNLNKDQVASLQNYLDFVDRFNPNIHSAERNFINVDNATRGAVSSDYAGMGAKNMAETAKALAKSDSYETALINARTGEQKVTQHFKELMERDKKIIETTLGTKKGIEKPSVNFSGDDGSTIFVKNADIKTKEELIHSLSKVENPGGRRFSFVNDKPKTDFDRNMLAKHGEDLEKYLRQELSGKMPRSTVDKVTFGIDMKGAAVGEGDVGLIIGNSRQRLDSNDLKTINEAFQRAVQKMNTSEAKKSIKRNSTYRATP